MPYHFWKPNYRISWTLTQLSIESFKLLMLHIGSRFVFWVRLVVRRVASSGWVRLPETHINLEWILRLIRHLSLHLSPMLSFQAVVIAVGLALGSFAVTIGPDTNLYVGNKDIAPDGHTRPWVLESISSCRIISAHQLSGRAALAGAIRGPSGLTFPGPVIRAPKACRFLCLLASYISWFPPVGISFPN